MGLARSLVGGVLDDKLVDGLSDRFEDVVSEHLILSLSDSRVLGAFLLVYAAVTLRLSDVDRYFALPLGFIALSLGGLGVLYRLAGTRPVAVWASVSLSLLVFIPMVSFYDYKLHELAVNERLPQEQRYRLDLGSVVGAFRTYADDGRPAGEREAARRELDSVYERTLEVERRFDAEVGLGDKAMMFAFKLMFSLLYIFLVFLASTTYLSNILAHRTKRGAFPLRRYWSLYAEKVGRVSCAYLVLLALCFQDVYPTLAFAMWFALPVLTMYVPMALLFGGSSNDVLYLSISRSLAARRRWHLLPLLPLALFFVAFLSKLPEGALTRHPAFIKVIGPALAASILGLSLFVLAVVAAPGLALVLVHRLRERYLGAFRGAGILRKLALALLSVPLWAVVVPLLVVGWAGGLLLRLKARLVGADQGADNVELLVQQYQPRILEFGPLDALYCPSQEFAARCAAMRERYGVFRRAGGAGPAGR